MAKREDGAMDGLTDEERKALEEADAEEGAAADSKAAADKAADDEAIAEAKAKTPKDPETGKFISKEEAEARAKKEPEGDSGLDQKAAEAEVGDEAEEEVEEPAPRRAQIWKAPEDADAKLADIAKRRDELSDKFDNGDLTAKEFNQELATLGREERAIERAQDRAQFAEEMRKDSWINEVVPEFLDVHTAYRDNEVLHNMLDAEVRKLQVVAIEKGADPLHPSILDRAHKAITGAIQNLTGKAPEQAEAKPAAKKGGLPKRPPAPPTLAHVPSADMTDTDGEFAVLDRLGESDPVKFEDTLAKMPAEKRERYLQYAH